MLNAVRVRHESQLCEVGDARRRVCPATDMITRARERGARVVVVAESTTTTEPNSHPATARPLRAL